MDGWMDGGFGCFGCCACSIGGRGGDEMSFLLVNIMAFSPLNSVRKRSCNTNNSNNNSTVRRPGRYTSLVLCVPPTLESLPCPNPNASLCDTAHGFRSRCRENTHGFRQQRMVSSAALSGRCGRLERLGSLRAGIARELGGVRWEDGGSKRNGWGLRRRSRGLCRKGGGEATRRRSKPPAMLSSISRFTQSRLTQPHPLGPVIVARLSSLHQSLECVWYAIQFPARQ